MCCKLGNTIVYKIAGVSLTCFTLNLFKESASLWLLSEDCSWCCALAILEARLVHKVNRKQVQSSFR